MLVKINGRELKEHHSGTLEIIDFVPVLEVKKSRFEHIKNALKMAVEEMSKFGPPPGMLFAGAPMVINGGGLIERLWPLTEHLQEFGFVAAVCMGLWGASRFIFGDPAGRQVVWQSILGYVLLMIIPAVFFAIRAALGGA